MNRARVVAVGFLLALLHALAGAAAAQERSMLPVTIDGENVKLAVITYKPPGDGPFPVLIFHHGSTGSGTDPKAFARPFDPFVLAHWFVARGWAVVLPSRRGRGGSEGLYDEGFDEDRTRGYTCDETRALAGAERALADIDAASAAILAWPFIDRTRFIVGGQSRGGILSVAWAGRHPDEPRGVVNFVGGWSGAHCQTTVNQRLFKMGATFPRQTLWLYGDRDFFYPLSYSSENFASFVAAGGRGTFQTFEPLGGVGIGHLIYRDDSLWSPTMDAYLAETGLPHDRREQVLRQ